MITIIGIREQDRRRVANSIVLALGTGGVCDRFSVRECASKMGGHDCHECAVKQIVFINSESTDGNSQPENNHLIQGVLEGIANHYSKANCDTDETETPPWEE